MNTCDTCKYFVDGYMIPTAKTGIRASSCNHPKHKMGYGESVNEPDEIVIENDEGWGWEVGPKFGCIHHEQL